MRKLVCSAILALIVGGCQTTGPVTANNPHPDLPPNYRLVIADYMKTQLFAQLSGPRHETAELSDPHRTWNGNDAVCVSFSGGSTVRAYVFSGGGLQFGTGGIVSQSGQGVLTKALACGSEPVFKPFPEWSR